jgi:transposase
MQVETDEPKVVERVAAPDVGKAEVVCCVRIPGPGGRRVQEVRTVSTMTVFQTWLVGARDVKHLPARPKTDRLEAVRLAKVAEQQMLRASFVPPRAISELRDLTRYRVDLLTTRTGEKQRVEKLLEDSLLRLSVRFSGGADVVAHRPASTDCPPPLRPGPAQQLSRYSD